MIKIELKDKRKKNIILADPPWKYNLNKINGCAENHYPTMSLKELKELNVLDYADNDCILFIWTTGPKMKESIELIESWRFEYKTMFAVWVKTNGII